MHTAGYDHIGHSCKGYYNMVVFWHGRTKLRKYSMNESRLWVVYGCVLVVGLKEYWHDVGAAQNGYFTFSLHALFTLPALLKPGNTYKNIKVSVAQHIEASPIAMDNVTKCEHSSRTLAGHSGSVVYDNQIIVVCVRHVQQRVADRVAATPPPRIAVSAWLGHEFDWWHVTMKPPPRSRNQSGL